MNLEGILMVGYCELSGNYIVLEWIVPKPGVPYVPIPNAAAETAKLLISPGTQIVRKVVQRCDLQVYTFDGKPVQGTPSWLDLIRHFTSPGQRLFHQPTGEYQYQYVYEGFTNVPEIVTFLPLAVSKHINFEYKPPGLYIMGTDPIPHARLYNNPAVTFAVSQGGAGVPFAAAVYDNKTRMLTQFPPSEMAATLKKLAQDHAH